MNDQNKKTLRQFQCRDYLWEIFEQMSGELECSVDYLINEAMRQYARSRNYGARASMTDPTGQRSAPTGAPAAAARPDLPTPGPRARIPSQPAIPSAPPPPPARPSFPQPGGHPPYAGGSPSPAPQQAYPPQQQAGYPPPPPSRSSPGGYPAPPAPPQYGGHGQGGGYPPPPAAQQPAGYGQAAGYPAPPPAPPPYGGYGQGGYPAPPPRPQAPAPSSYPPPPQTTRPPAMGGGGGGYAAPPPLPNAPVGQAGGTHPAGMPTLYVIFNGQKFPVNKEEFIIGRGTKTADLAIKDGNISRRHAAVIYQNGGFYMKDLGSTNGIEFQGRRVDGRRIEEGDVYQLCDYELRFTYR